MNFFGGALGRLDLLRDFLSVDLADDDDDDDDLGRRFGVRNGNELGDLFRIGSLEGFVIVTAESSSFNVSLFRLDLGTLCFFSNSIKYCQPVGSKCRRRSRTAC